MIGSRVGDAICTTPAVQVLRTYFPEAHIGLITCSEVASQVFQDNPNVDQIYTSPPLKEIKSISQQYDVALDLHKSPLSRDYIQHLKIPCFSTAGPDPLHLRDHPLQLIYNLYPDCQLRPQQNYDLFIRDEHHAAIKKKLQEQGAKLNESEILISVHMGCWKVADRATKFWWRKIETSRTWPFENYRQLYDSLRKQDDRFRFVMTGTPSEHRVIKKYFRTAKGVINLAGKTSIHELAALMSHCRIFLTGDTGPMHVASCTNVPMIALFGSTTPEVTGPHPMRDTIICLQEKTSIRDIKVSTVKQKIEFLLK